MRLLKLILTLTITACLFAPVQAQFLDKLKRKLGNTLEDHAVEQVNKGVDKALQKVEDKMWDKMFGVSKSTMDSLAVEAEKDPEAFQKAMEQYSTGGSNISIGDEYSFTSTAVYKMNTASNDKKSSMDYTMMLNPDKPYMATRMGSMEMEGKKNDMAKNMTMIMDFEANAMVMVMEDQKMVNVMSLDKMGNIQDADTVSSNATIKKTGKTKKILGHTCDEYLITSDNMEGSLWIAPDLESFSKVMYKNIGGNAALANNPSLKDMKGMMMEMDMTVQDEKGKGSSKLEMQIVSLDQATISFIMSDYQKLSFGGMGMGGKK